MQTRPSPPPTHASPVVDHLHGHEIVDPYRWLETADSPETVTWVDEQNAYTRSLLDSVPGRDQMHQHLETLFAVGAVGTPVLRDGRYFYTRHDGRQNQPVLYVREGESEPERVLVDPNVESTEGTVALDWWYPSWDGRLLAYGFSDNGDEWSTLRVLDVDTGEHLPDRIERARYASVAWLPDGAGFYYTRYPKRGDVPEGEENYGRRIFHHMLGADPSQDREIFGADLDAEQMPSVSISEDGRYLIVTVSTGWSRSDIWLRDLSLPDGEFVPVAVGYDALFGAVTAGDKLWLLTNLDAPRYRVFAVDPARPEREGWREIIAERVDAVLEGITPSAGRIIAQYLRNATSSLALYEQDGTQVREIPLPTLGTITGVSGRWQEREAFYRFESFTLPPTVYRLSPESLESEVWAAVEAPIDPGVYEVRQEWYTSRDGTPISMFLIHRRDAGRPELRPTVLTGYGGFNISRTPLFARNIFLWLDAGGLYALPNLRGGGEYGEEWHRAGMLERKQNVFDDFIAAAEHLIAERYTEPSRLAITGGSNGGLLVGVALTQRPDLFRAVVCSVPLLDMLRYHHFLIARLWIPEYGSADDPDQFPFIYAYSPYHHVRSRESYPAVLFTTAESDSRVDPMHARKMAALLQAANASEHPILLRVEQKAGHGVGKPLAKLIEDQVDIWAFIFWQLGVQPHGVA